MKLLKARVMRGRLVMDEPTDLPEGTEVDVVIVERDAAEALDPERLRALIRARLSEADAGGVVDADDVWRELDDKFGPTAGRDDES